MMIPRRGHWYAVELPIPILVAAVPLMLGLLLTALSIVHELLP
jgi:hypothetical protein